MSNIEAIFMASKPSTFVRDATGLVRNLSLLDAIALNVSDLSAGATLAVIGYTTILLPSMSGVNLVYASLISFAMVIPQITIYTMMTQRVPRTGGDYVWVSRSLGGFLGNVLAFPGYTLGNLPFASLIAMSTVFAIGSVGVALGYSGLLGLALPGNIQGADTMSQFIIASAILIILVAINIIKPKIAYKLISIFTIIGVFTLVLAIATLWTAGRNGVINFMNSFGQSSLTYQAVAGSYSGPSFDLAATAQFVPYFALFTYPWVNAASAVASEIKGKSSIKWSVSVSAILVMVLVTSALGTMYAVGGFEFVNGAFANPTLVYNYSFSFWTLAMGVASSPVIAWLIGIGWILWVVNILAYLVIVEGRYLLAQAFDRFLPSKVAYVSKYGSPVIAHLVDLVIMISLIGGAAFLYGTFVSLYGTIVGPMIYFMFVGIAAVIYGVRHEKGRSKAVLIVAGIISATVFFWLTAEFLLYPAIWGGNWLAYDFIIASAIIAALIYGISKWYHSRQGIDISLVFKQIPPE